MASLTPGSPPTSRARRAPDAPGPGVLPPEVLFDVLLHLPEKDLCRFRAVCRAWRSLTSDPIFLTAHAARHPGPLFLAKFQDDKKHVYVVDLSGKVIKRVAGAAAGPHDQLLCTRLNLACLATDWNRCRVFNPATGAVHVLPQSPAAEHVNRVNLCDPYTIFALGWVSSTGEYKVLRMFNRIGFQYGGQQLFDVFTINGATDHARWRGVPSPGLFIEEYSGAGAGAGTVVDGVVYFFTSRVRGGVIHPDHYIVSFDLGTEEWRKHLRGPLSGDIAIYRRSQLTLAELKGSLVLAHCSYLPSTTDIWFLVDFENGRWVKEYSIWTGSIVTSVNVFHLIPLSVLDDGRLVVYLASGGLLFICDPRTNTCTKVDMRLLDSVGVYNGNLLSLQEGVVL